MASPHLLVSATGLILGALALLHLAGALICRPQRGLLLLAALLPFDGLLLIIPGGETFGPWKEALLVVTLLSVVVSSHSARASGPIDMPRWVPALIALVTLGLVSAVSTGGTIGLWGFKISFLYAVVPLILWRCPFTARDRDRLVSILMATGVLTALVGLGQQLAGPARLNDVGYEYNSAIRFSGGLLRSFSTFTQPFSFGLFVSLVLLVCLPVAMADARRTRNLLFLLASPVMVVGMASSVVRGATLALLVGLVVLFAWRFRSIFHAMVPAAVAVLFVPVGVLTDYFSSSSLDQRTTGWQTIFDSLLTAPLGNGIGTTGSAAEKSLELGADISDLVTDGGSNLYLPDSQYVKTIIELGPIGLWLLLLLGAAVIATAIAAARRTSGNDQALAQGIAASVVGAAAASLVANYLEIFPLDFYFWLLIGVLLSIGNPAATNAEANAAAEAEAGADGTDGRTDGRTDGPTDGPTDEPTDEPTHRLADPADPTGASRPLESVC